MNLPSVFYPLSLYSVAVAISLATPLCSAQAEEGIELDNVYITGGKDEVLRQPGSATLIDDVALEVFEYSDIHRVLNAVPGVNLQEEDGYGLRPNIGLRGTSPERSKKITVMEDGILSGPSPYSAPAAYYFPNISRMSAVEVFKGPSTIQYGPATVGGAINMVSRPIPYSSEGELDVQYGTDNFQRYSAYQGQQIGDFGYVIEGLRLSTDGFKEIDGSNDSTGFVRNDVNLKTNWQTLGDVSQLFQLKLGYADEVSNETYLGLSRDDFDEKSNRRYVSSALDKSEWDHQQYQFTHQIEFDDVVVTTDVYRNNFDRDWFKINGFNTHDESLTLDKILADPNSVENQPYYDVLTGAAGSTDATQQLRLGNNGREYFSQGIQTRVNQSFDFLSWQHDVEVGLRIHQDQVERHHTEQNYSMAQGGDMQAIAGTYKTTARNTNDALAVAIYIQDKIQIDDTTVSLGLRHESIETSKTTYGNLTGVEEQKNTLNQSILLPGVGIYSQLNQDIGILVGIYKGFTAATANTTGETEPELSTNYELGARYSGYGQGELVGFLNDYSQFSGTCSFAQGSCDSDITGEQSNAGSAVVYGLEASWGHGLSVGGFLVPVSTTYTFTQGEFGEDFVDTTGAFGERGQEIQQGYSIGYLPEHRLSAQIGLAKDLWQVNASLLYQSEMRNVPGTGSIAEADLIEEHTIVDLSASYQAMPALQVYSAIDNIFDEQYVAGVKPYGFRPGKPRAINLGAKYQF